ncbi:hypothetical protein [Aeromonas hydrophila]|uniref:hypothetical protein n=1 Tax=Aeromonas hydrophila TaxID=644 RepID=UPI002B4776A7|nr:hypothetical protein [Aeromonas hydrophila]
MRTPGKSKIPIKMVILQEENGVHEGNMSAQAQSVNNILSALVSTMQNDRLDEYDIEILSCIKSDEKFLQVADLLLADPDFNKQSEHIKRTFMTEASNRKTAFVLKEKLASTPVNSLGMNKKKSML